MNLTCLQCLAAACCRSPAAVYLGSKSRHSRRLWAIRPRSCLWEHLHSPLLPVYWVQMLHCGGEEKETSYRYLHIIQWVCVNTRKCTVLMQGWLCNKIENCSVLGFTAAPPVFRRSPHLQEICTGTHISPLAQPQIPSSQKEEVSHERWSFLFCQKRRVQDTNRSWGSVYVGWLHTLQNIRYKSKPTFLLMSSILFHSSGFKHTQGSPTCHRHFGHILRGILMPPSARWHRPLWSPTQYSGRQSGRVLFFSLKVTKTEWSCWHSQWNMPGEIWLYFASINDSQGKPRGPSVKVTPTAESPAPGPGWCVTEKAADPATQSSLEEDSQPTRELDTAAVTASDTWTFIMGGGSGHGGCNWKAQTEDWPWTHQRTKLWNGSSCPPADPVLITAGWLHREPSESGDKICWGITSPSSSNIPYWCSLPGRTEMKHPAWRRTQTQDPRTGSSDPPRAEPVVHSKVQMGFFYCAVTLWICTQTEADYLHVFSDYC